MHNECFVVLVIVFRSPDPLRGLAHPLPKPLAELWIVSLYIMSLALACPHLRSEDMEESIPEPASSTVAPSPR